MQFKKFVQNNKKHIIDYSVLLIGILACCFSRLTFNMFFCAFIFPGCFLFFARRTKAYIGLPAIFAGSLIGCGIALWKLIAELGVGLQIALAFVVALITWLPYLFDKLIYARFFSKHPFILTFLFPLTWVIIDIVMGFTPVGNYISIGYIFSQIIQAASIVSLFGLHVLSFMIIYFNSAFASFANNWKQNKKAVIVASSICGFSLLYSGAYNIIPTNYSKTIRMMTGYSTNDGEALKRTKLSIDDNKKWLLTDINMAKDANVRILMYPEEAFWVYDTETVEFQQYLKQKSAEKDIFIVAGVQWSKQATPKQNLKNLAWVATPNGELIEYQKLNLVPWDEGEYEPGIGEPITFNVDGSKVGLVICMDLEFPSYVSKLGRTGCDILLAPSWDWQTMPSNHSISDAYRAIENGFNFVRCTEDGYSIATDFKGNIITQYCNDILYEHKAHKNHIFSIPAQGRKTLYSWIAPGVNYCYIVALVTLITYCVIIDHKKSKRKPLKK